MSAFLLLLAVNAVYKSVIRDEDETLKFQQGVPEGILVSNVGTSHGQSAFVYDDMPDGITGFNFAIGGQDYTYDLRVVQNYSDKLQKGGVMLIPVSYCSLFANSEDQFDSSNTRYYKFLSPEYIKEYDPKVAVFYKYFPVCIGYEKVFSKTFSKLLDSIKGFFGKNIPEQNTGLTEAIATEEALKEYAEERYYAHVGCHLNLKTGTYAPDKEEKEALCELIDFCREKGITPVLITTPVLLEYNRLVLANQDFMAVFQSFVKEICSTKGVSYFDYSADERFCSRYDYFFDTDHLDGKEGSRMFTNTVWKEIVAPLCKPAE